MPFGLVAAVLIRHYARYSFAILIHHHRRNTHNESVVPVGGLLLLNGIGGGAVESIIVKTSIHLLILREAPSEHRDGIVAAIAVARKFNALRSQQNIHAGAVERCAKGVGMQRLAPLAIGFRVTSAAVFRGRKRV